MKIKDLKEEHPAIYKLINDRYNEQLEEGPVRVINGKDPGGFHWHSTTEGTDFWGEIFWYENYQVFYDRYPEHAKEKDWSKASDEELIAEAKRRYPVGTGITYQDRGFALTKDEPYLTGGLIGVLTDHEQRGGKKNSYYYLYSRQDGWAEIVSHPNIAYGHGCSDEDKKKITSEFIKHWSGSGNSGSPILLQNPSEPKAGDMVEVLLPNGNWSKNHLYYMVGKTKYGAYVVQDSIDEFYELNNIRLPQESEVESKIKELMENHRSHEFTGVWYYTSDTVEVIIEQAIKWAQQNPKSQ